MGREPEPGPGWQHRAVVPPLGKPDVQLGVNDHMRISPVPPQVRRPGGAQVRIGAVQEQDCAGVGGAVPGLRPERAFPVRGMAGPSASRCG